MKLLITFLATNKEPFTTIRNKGIYKTWVKDAPNNVNIFPLFGNNSFKKPILENNKLILPVNCSNLTEKTKLAFKYFIDNNFDFDYLIRTNESTYVRINELLRYLKSKSRENFHAGYPAKKGNIIYASGTAMIYSRDLIEDVSNNMDKIKGHPDDVEIGKYFQSKGILPENVKRLNIQDTNMELTKKEVEKKLSDDVFFIRCKTNKTNGKKFDQNKMTDIRKKNDTEKMIFLYNYFHTKL